jgi:hypothetical protein
MVSLKEETGIGVPLECNGVRSVSWRGGHPDLASVEGQVVLTVVEVLPQTPAHSKAVVGCDCRVASIEQRVDVGAEQEPVVDAMLAFLGDGSDVCRLQNRKDLLAGDRAATLVGLGHQGHQYLERALPEARPHQDRLAEHPPRLDLDLDVQIELARHRPERHVLPQPRPVRRRREVVALPGLDVLAEVLGRWEPVGPVEEERLREHDAADLVVLARSRDTPVALDPSPHLLDGRSPVLRAETPPTPSNRGASSTARRTRRRR